MVKAIPWVIMGVIGLAIAAGSAALWVIIPPDPTFGGVETPIDATPQDSNPETASSEAPLTTDAKTTEDSSPISSGNNLAQNDEDSAPTGDSEAPSFATGLDQPTLAAGTPPPAATPSDENDTPPSGNAPQFADPSEQIESPAEAPEEIDPTTGGFPATDEIEITSTLQTLQGKKPLKPAPDPALVQSTAQGPLPIISDDGQKFPWSTYARPFYDSTVRPRISLLLVNMGINAEHTTTALQTLPSDISIAFPPYVRNVDYWAQQSRQVGHEVYIQLPLEPFNYPSNDPGPRALLTVLDRKENAERLEWVMTRFPGYVGLVNLMGGRFTSSERHMSDVLNTLKKNGLAFIEQHPAEFSQVSLIARKMITPFKQSDIMVDADPAQAAIRARLDELVALANENRTALGVIHPYPSTIKTVMEWSETLEGEGIVLAPASAILTQGGR